MRLTWVKEKINDALVTLHGWGGAQGLRQVGWTRWWDDPYLAWALPQARYIIMMALEEGGRILQHLDREDLQALWELYEAALQAGIDAPKGLGRKLRDRLKEVA